MRLGLFVSVGSFLAVALVIGLSGGVSAAKYSGKEMKLTVRQGPYEQVSIRVDKASKADADHVLFEAQGYHAAKDRFIQMDLTRRAGGATLSELFGKSALSRDKTVISVGIRRATAATVRKIVGKYPETYALLESYAVGINRFLREAEITHPSLIRFYRRLTNNPNYVPERWRPQDSLAIASSLEFYLSSAMQQKLLLGAIFHLVLGGDAKKLRDFMDLRAIENEFVLPKKKNRASRRPSSLPRLAGAIPSPINMRFEWIPLGYPFPGPGFPHGSNAWVVSRGFAGAKAAYLANDPHLPMFFPSTFLEVALDSTPAGGSFRVKGMSVPGLPGIFVGHNDTIGWGVTNALGDVDDVYLETLSNDGLKTKFMGHEVRIKTKRHFLKVRNKKGKLDTKVVVIRWVPHHGPIVSDHIPGLLLPPGLVLSYRWVGHEGSFGLNGILDLNRAGDFEQFKSALQQWEVGAQNFAYCDVSGNIGFYMSGRFPVRPDPGRVVAPFLPVPGRGSYEWEGYREKLPEVFNPKIGRIVTANNDPYGKNAERFLSSYDDYFSYRFAVGARAKRITQLLHRKRGRLNIDEMRKIQWDHKDLVAERILGLLRQVLRQRKKAERIMASISPEAFKLGERLLRWDARMERDSVDAQLFNTWFTFLLEEHFSVLKESGLLKGFLNSQFAIQSLCHRLKDLLKSNPDYVHELFAKTLNKLHKRIKTTHLGKTRWGEIHRLGFAAPLAGFLNQAITVPLERDGSWFTIDVGGYIAGDRAEINGHNLPNFYGANFRLVLAFEKGKPIQGWAVSPTGGAGRMDPFTSVQEMTMWQNGKLRKLVEFVP